jgi:predicted secreted protein
MDKMVAGLNIEYLRKQLATEIDQTKRQTMERILDEEEAKLAVLNPERKRRLV